MTAFVCYDGRGEDSCSGIYDDRGEDSCSGIYDGRGENPCSGMPEKFLKKIFLTLSFD